MDRRTFALSSCISAVIGGFAPTARALEHHEQLEIPMTVQRPLQNIYGAVPIERSDMITVGWKDLEVLIKGENTIIPETPHMIPLSIQSPSANSATITILLGPTNGAELDAVATFAFHRAYGGEIATRIKVPYWPEAWSVWVAQKHNGRVILGTRDVLARFGKQRYEKSAKLAHA